MLLKQATFRTAPQDGDGPSTPSLFAVKRVRNSDRNSCNKWQLPLLTQLSRCCKPAPPDAIGGFVTRGKGVSIHRQDCSNFRELASRHGERVIDVRWGQSKGPDASVYPVDVSVEAFDRQGLLRDISEVFAKEKMNVIGVQTQSVKGTAWMTFTVEIGDAVSLNKVLVSVRTVKGVRAAKRR
jgi:GTP pyrophosphokinase